MKKGGLIYEERGKLKGRRKGRKKKNSKNKGNV